MNPKERVETGEGGSKIDASEGDRSSNSTLQHDDSSSSSSSEDEQGIVSPPPNKRRRTRRRNSLMRLSAALHTETTQKPKTAIVLLNMGGPQTVDEVGAYLHRIMTDRDMIQLPVQSKLGPWIASRRTDEVKKKYMEIGGGSPILKWTNLQGSMLTKALDQMLPESAPHKHYVAFRYVPPFTEETFEQLEKDGVERAVIFSQYPQYSCATTGSSLNAIADFYRNRQIPQNIKFSMIERWPTHPLLAKVFAERIKEKLNKFDPSLRDDVLIMFTAHSLPLKAVSRGDTYPHEVAATVAATMNELKVPNPHRLVWQSKVGPLPWLQPYTDDAIKAVSRGDTYPHEVAATVAATMNELKVPNPHRLVWQSKVGPLPWLQPYTDDAIKAGVKQIERASAPNDHPIFIAALADVVAKHLTNAPRVSKQFLSRCPHCVSERCKSSKEFFSKLCQSSLKDKAYA
ncbi:Ferrochelatase, mitochondrial [Papilio machaon]|uniref:Ferrochelatase n=2 Tax=Papilio machaon TaxID=76193 RepID=A0A0N0PDD9_PAPMA|nr:Ferrochelatase, mitochondrial [Papilio machaon]